MLFRSANIWTGSGTRPFTRKRGIRAVIGGNYGFAWTPRGTNARDLEHFVKLFGYSPGEALECATRIGGELMGMGHELGLIK
jgi:imidazolonepropionase-like amidohydrolase